MTRWNALVLAGDRGPTDPVATAAGVRTKAFAPIAGRPMIDHVLDALRDAAAVGEIAVSIADDAPDLPDDVKRLTSGSTPATSVAAGFAAMGAPLLVATADHPLLTAAMVDDFLAGAEAAKVDVGAGVALRPVVERAGNTAKRTYLKFRDGEISGCNLFALSTPAAAGAVEFWKEMEAHRKRPLKMARKVGLWPLAVFALGLATRDKAAAMIGARAGCTAIMIPLDHPNAAHDVDKASDMAFAEAQLTSS